MGFFSSKGQKQETALNNHKQLFAPLPFPKDKDDLKYKVRGVFKDAAR